MRWGLNRCCCGGGSNPYFGAANNFMQRRNGADWSNAQAGSWSDVSSTPDAGVWVAKAALTGDAAYRMNLTTGATETSWPIENCRSIGSIATCLDGGIAFSGNFQVVASLPPYLAIQKRTAAGDLLWVVEIVVDGLNRTPQSICADQNNNLYATFAAGTTLAGPPWAGGAYSVDADGGLRWFRQLWTPTGPGFGTGLTFASADLQGFVWVTIQTAPEAGVKVYKLDALTGATQGTVAFPGVPRSIGNDVDGNLYVTVFHPTLGSSLKSYSPAGTLRWSVSVSNPGDLGVNRKGTIFVANSLLATVSGYDTDGNAVSISGTPSASYRAIDVGGGKIGAFGA